MVRRRENPTPEEAAATAVEELITAVEVRKIINRRGLLNFYGQKHISAQFITMSSARVSRYFCSSDEFLRDRACRDRSVYPLCDFRWEMSKYRLLQLRHLTVGVAVVELNVCERLSSSSVKLSVSALIFTRMLLLGLGHSNVGRVARTKVFEGVFWVTP